MLFRSELPTQTEPSSRELPSSFESHPSLHTPLRISRTVSQEAWTRLVVSRLRSDNTQSTPELRRVRTASIEFPDISLVSSSVPERLQETPEHYQYYGGSGRPPSPAAMAGLESLFNTSVEEPVQRSDLPTDRETFNKVCHGWFPRPGEFVLNREDFGVSRDPGPGRPAPPKQDLIVFDDDAQAEDALVDLSVGATVATHPPSMWGHELH